MIEYVEGKEQKEKHIFIREIEQKAIITEPSLRSLCKSNQCGNYNTNWMCPPGIGTYEEVINRLRSCKDGIILLMVYQLEDSFDLEGMNKAFSLFRAKLDELIEDITLHIPREELLCLGGGRCKICDTCTFASGEPCRYPHEAIASVSGYCIDVNSTVTNAGLNYNNGPNTVTNVGLILKRPL